MRQPDTLRPIPLWQQPAVTAADVLWLGFIFSHSLRNAAVSSGQSGRVVRLIRQLLGFDAPWLEHFVRKLAHFGEFFILGCLAALTAAAFLYGQRHIFRRAAAPAALCGLLAALTDETLQLTSAGRTAKVTDVWLDWAGYLCGAAALAGILLLIRRHRVQKNRKKAAQTPPTTPPTA